MNEQQRSAFRIRTTLALGILAVGVLSLSAAPPDSVSVLAEVDQILQQSGVRGGLVVHLGCGDGRLTAALGARDGYLVHGLDADDGNVAAARRHVRSLGRYGKVSIDRLSGLRLPYADGLVNLLVVDGVQNVPADEISRVLCPGGVSLAKESSGWSKTVKPVSDELDEWTHWLHAADGNPVARDRVVGPPRHVQWFASPFWARHHDTVPSTTAMVTSAGRLFYISDEAPACLEGTLPDSWFLVARDAYNGVLLWKRPIEEWGWSQWGAEWKGRFNIPPQLPKRLVAAGDRLYATSNFNAPLTALDAATGRVLHEYEGTENTDEILYQDGLLILALNDEARRPTPDEQPPLGKTVCVLDAQSGEILWRKSGFVGLRAKYNTGEPFGRLEMSASHDAIFLADHDAVVCLDLRLGRELWRVARPAIEEHLVMYGIRMSDQSVMVYQDGVLLYAQPRMKKTRSWHSLPGTVYAYNAADGKLLWEHPYGGWSHNWQPDVFAIDGVVWLFEHADVAFDGHDPPDKDQIDYAVIGLDLATGRPLERFSVSESFNVGHHHRCYRGKATERFLLASRRGVEFIDLDTGENHLHHWARGACLHGFVPANGLLYLAPHPCECYIEAKLNGYYALAAKREEGEIGREGDGERGGARLERGPAYEPTAYGLKPTASSSWPTYRHDPLRSGSTAATVSVDLARSWSTAVGRRLSPPVAVAGRVFVAAIDEHRVVALDGDTGRELWSFTAGGRIDSPPTVHDGRVLFGSADGFVYSLLASDGQLAWRLQAAPERTLVGAEGQLESAWPVHGSVLVVDGVAYLAAGRSSYLDGGIHLLALNPASGEVIRRQVIYSPDPDTGKMPPGDARTIPGALSDILTSDGESVYMRAQQVFGDDSTAGAHLYSTAGLLDDSWFNRTHWTVGSVGGAQLLVFDADTAYAVSAYPGRSSSHAYQPAEKGYLLLAEQWRSTDANNRAADKKSKASSKGSKRRWEQRVPLRATGLALAGRTLLAAGTPDVVDPADPLAALEGRLGAELWLISADDGSKLAGYDLPNPPVFDGLIVVSGRLYVSTIDGNVLCLSNQ